MGRQSKADAGDAPETLVPGAPLKPIRVVRREITLPDGSTQIVDVPVLPLAQRPCGVDVEQVVVALPVDLAVSRHGQRVAFHNRQDVVSQLNIATAVAHADGVAVRLINRIVDDFAFVLVPQRLEDHAITVVRVKQVVSQAGSCVAAGKTNSDVVAVKRVACDKQVGARNRLLF